MFDELINLFKGHLTHAKRVIVTTTPKDVPLLIVGVNHDDFRLDMRIVSAGPPSLNCICPLLKVLSESFPIKALVRVTSENFIKKSIFFTARRAHLLLLRARQRFEPIPGLHSLHPLNHQHDPAPDVHEARFRADRGRDSRAEGQNRQHGCSGAHSGGGRGGLHHRVRIVSLNKPQTMVIVDL